MIKILNLKLVILVRISKYKNIFAKGYMPNWSKEVFVTKKGKNKKKLLENFMKKNCRRLINKDLELKKCFKKKEINYMFNGYGRVMVVYLIVGLIKKIQCDCNVRLKTRFSSYMFKILVALQRIKKSQYFPKPYEAFGRDINVKVDLSNYATKTDIKNISHVDTSSFALETN